MGIVITTSQPQSHIDNHLCSFHCTKQLYQAIRSGNPLTRSNHSWYKNECCVTVLLMISDGIYIHMYVHCTYISLNHSFDPTLMSVNRIYNVCNIVLLYKSQRMGQIRNIKKHKTTEFYSFYFVVLIIVHSMEFRHVEINNNK